jgi:hypothetical protein
MELYNVDVFIINLVLFDFDYVVVVPIAEHLSRILAPNAYCCVLCSQTCAALPSVSLLSYASEPL